MTWSRKAAKDYRELEFSTDGAIECLKSLDEGEYRKSLEYDDGKGWDDYLAVRVCPNVGRRRLYIKLRIPSPASVDYVYVTSFHLENVA
ncbi:hypothetical protein D3C81_353550 [compost metagenome]